MSRAGRGELRILQRLPQKLVLNPIPPRGPLVYASLTSVLLLCALPVLQPFHRLPLTAFYTEWLAFALGLGVMLVLLDRRAWISAGLPWLALSVFVLALLLIVHGALGWSPYFGIALTGALYLIWAGLLMIAARALVQMAGTETVFAVVAAGLAGGALLNAAIGMIQYFNWITPFNAFITRLQSAAVFGNLAQPNHFAAWTTLGLLSLAYLHGRSRLPLPAYALCVLPLLFVMGVSGSRSPWLYLLLAFACAFWLRMASGAADRTARRLFLSTGLFLILHYAMQLAVGAGWFTLDERPAVTAIERLFSGAESVSDRIGLWRVAWAIAIEHPVTGIGWGAFAGQYFDYISRPGILGPNALFNNAHNILLQFFVETGVAGIVLVVAPLVAWLVHVLRGRLDPDRWWLLALLGVFGIHSLLEYPLWYAYFLGIAAVLLGLGSGPVFVPRLAKWGRSFTVAVVMVGVYNLAVLWADYSQFERLFRPTPAQRESSDFPTLIARLHGNALLAPYVELSSAFPLEIAEQNLAGRLLLIQRVTRFSPIPVLIHKQVLLLALAGRPAEARELLVRIRRTHPAASAEFDRELMRLGREYPARFRPLIESAAHVPGGK